MFGKTATAARKAVGTVMKMADRTAAGAVLVIVAATVGGCTTPHRSAVTDVDPTGWQTAAEIVLPNRDTLSLRDVGLFLRCNDRFSEDTLTVRVTVLTPDSLRYEEHFLLAIPRRTGPAALTREAEIPYRRRVRFDRTGDYRFRITPSRPVRGVEAVGIDWSKNEGTQ